MTSFLLALRRRQALVDARIERLNHAIYTILVDCRTSGSKFT